MASKGTITFQSNGAEDIFYVADVREEGIEHGMLELRDTQFEGDHAWVTGDVPRLKRVSIPGDTAMINAWFRAEHFDDSFMITIYVEYEEAEEVVTPEQHEIVQSENVEVEGRRTELI